MTKTKPDYDRQKPNMYELLERLESYSEKDYGAAAYDLSRAEAKLLLAEINYLEEALAKSEGPGFCE